MGQRASRVRVAVRVGMALLLTGVVVVSSAGTAGADFTHAESGDAGDLLATAQEPIGAGALTSISGTVSNREDADVYKICIDSNATWSATTVGTAGTLGDTQLWLFNSSGQGVEMNDEATDSTDRSTLPLAHNPGPATNGGTYYLAISAYDNDALDAPTPLGFLIFPEPFGTSVVGSISNERTLGGWNDNLDNPLDPKTYTIALTGTRSCSPPPPSTSVCTALPATPPGGAIVGTSGPDKLAGTTGDDVIYGLGGDDQIAGLGGNDTIVGGSGIDRIIGGDGNDTLCGGTEVDYLTGGNGNDQLEGDAGDDQLDGSAGTNVLIGGTGTDACANGATITECNP